MIEVIITSSTDNNSNFCHRVLCRQCKETHVIDLDTKYHHMTLYGKNTEKLTNVKIIQTIRTKYMNAIVNRVIFKSVSIAITTKFINMRVLTNESSSKNVQASEHELYKIQILLASPLPDYGLCQLKSR